MSLGQRVVYDGGLSLDDEYVGITRYNPRKYDDVVSREIILHPNAPAEYSDLQTFVTAIDRAEKRRDAQTAKELIFSLPVELSREEQIAFAHWCIKEFWVSLGMCAYVCIHDRGNGNPHVHAILTTRVVDSNGFSKQKNRDWNNRKILLRWRKFLSTAINRELEKKVCKKRVSHLSYVAQGKKGTPTKYLNPKASALERDGFATDQGDHNREIIAARQLKLEAERELETTKTRSKGRRRGRTY